MAIKSNSFYSIKDYIRRVKFRKRALIVGGSLLVLLLLLLTFYVLYSFIFSNEDLDYFDKTSLQIENSQEIDPNSQTLGLKKKPDGQFIRFNVPIYTTDIVNFQSNIYGEDIVADFGNGEVYASNLIYSLAGGIGINVIGGQDLTLVNTDPGSLQNIFKTVKVGDDELLAESNEDILNFVSGYGIALSINADGEIVIGNSRDGDATGDTINNVTNIIEEGGWEEEGSVVKLKGENSGVAIGSNSVAVGNVLDVTGNTSLAGNLAVTGDAAFNAVLINNNAKLADDLLVDGNTVLSGHLSLSKDSKFHLGYEDSTLSKNTKMAIAGNVGLGTNDAQANLHVTGDGQVPQVRLDAANEQTSNVFELRDTLGEVKIAFDSEGNANFEGTITQGGVALSKEGLSFEDGSDTVTLDLLSNEPVNQIENGDLEEDLSNWTSSTPTAIEKLRNPGMNSNLDHWGSNGMFDWYNENWKYRKNITFNNAAQGEDLQNFPVLIKLDSSNFDFSKAQNNGNDIRFTDSDGNTLLDYEIEKWDSTGEEAFIWVNVPQVDKYSDTDDIFVYYGNPSASSGEDVLGTWNSRYRGVWHLADDPSLGSAVNSKINGFEGSLSGGMTSDDLISGQVNTAFDFDGMDDVFSIPSVTSLGTMSYWGKDPSGDWNHYVYSGGVKYKNGVVEDFDERYYYDDGSDTLYVGKYYEIPTPDIENITSIPSTPADPPFVLNNIGGEFISDWETVAWGDYNDDGYVDLYVGNGEPTVDAVPSNLWKNNGDGTFTQINIPGDTCPVAAATWGDYDNDLDLDLYVACGDDEQNKLWENTGSDTFVANDIPGDDDKTKSATFGDYNNDGYLDIYLTNNDNQLNYIWFNNGDKTFTYHHIDGDWRRSNGSASVDFDNDGDLDIYTSNYGGTDVFWINDGTGSFAEYSLMNLDPDEDNHGGLEWGDYNNDGYFDLHVVDVWSQNLLWHNNGDSTFTSANISGDDSYNWYISKMADYNLDGDLDIYVVDYGGSNNLFKNNGDGSFSKINISGDTGDSTCPAWGDYDNDGDLDLYGPQKDRINNLWKNVTDNSNKSLIVRPLDTAGYKNQFGAQVRIYEAGTTTLVGARSIDGGNRAQNQYDAFFGVDPLKKYDIEIKYLGGTVMDKNSVPELGNVDVSKRYIVYKAGLNSYEGGVDEVRISDTARSADWIAAEYKSMNGTFIDMQEEQQWAGGEYVTIPTYNSTGGAAKINAMSMDVNYIQQVDLNSTEEFKFSIHAYAGGDVVDDSKLSLYVQGSEVSPANTVYTDLGGGWYRVEADIIGSIDTEDYGVIVKTGNIVYVDEASLILKNATGVITHNNDPTKSFSSNGSVEIDSTATAANDFIQEVNITTPGEYNLTANIYNALPPGGGVINGTVVTVLKDGTEFPGASYSIGSEGWYSINRELTFSTAGTYTVGFDVKAASKVYIDTVTLVQGRGSDRTLSISNSGSGLAYFNVESTTTLNSGIAENSALIIKGSSEQVADLVQIQTDTGDVIGAITEVGSWSLNKDLKIVLDRDEGSDSFFQYDSNFNRVEAHVDGTEVMRIKDDGSVDVNNAVNTSAFDLAESYPTYDESIEAGDIVALNTFDSYEEMIKDIRGMIYELEVKSEKLKVENNEEGDLPSKEVVATESADLEAETVGQENTSGEAEISDIVEADMVGHQDASESAAISPVEDVNIQEQIATLKEQLIELEEKQKQATTESGIDKKRFEVVKADSINHKNVIGIVSTKPGFVLGGSSFVEEKCRINEKLKVKNDKQLKVKNENLGGDDEASASACRGGHMCPPMDEEEVGTVASDEAEINNEKFMALHCQAPKQVAIALAGRVPVKIIGEIKEGELITISEQEGYGQKLTGSGWAIGRALESSNCEIGENTQSPGDSLTCQSTVMVMVMNTYINGGGILTSVGEKDIDNVSMVAEEVLDYADKTINDTCTEEGPALSKKDASDSADTITETPCNSSLQENLKTTLTQNNNLTITGNTSLSDTTIAGNLMIGGKVLMSDNTINTTSPDVPLKIQSNKQSPIEFMGGWIKFFTNGNIETKGKIKVDGIETTENYAGKVVIPAGELEIEVNRDWEEVPKTINITKNSAGDIWYENLTEEGFTIKLDEKSEKDIEVSWIVLW